MNASLFDYAGGIQLLEGVEITVLLPVILAGICVIGFAGNSLIFIALIHDFRNGKVSLINTLLINLSITDLLIIVLCIPIRAVTYSRQWWTLGGFVCKTADWFQHCCLLAKSFTLAAVSHARCNYILNPTDYVSFNPKRTVGTIVAIWIVSLVLPIPHMIFTTLVQHNVLDLCVFEVPLFAVNFMSVFSKIYPVVAYVIPVIYTVTCYSKVVSRNKPRMNKAPNGRKQNKLTTLMLVCVSVTYALMWLPDLSAWIWARHNFSNAFKPYPSLFIFAQVFLYVSSTANPIIFFAMSEDFRDSLYHVWLSLIRKSSKAPRDTQSPILGENVAEVTGSVINCLQDLKTVSPPESQEALGMEACDRILPDLEHFWQERRNTTAGDEQDPIPWERENKA